MATKELVKKDAVKKETAISPFVIFQTEIADIREAMNVNVGDGGLNATDLERIKIPAGGGTAWTIQGLDGEEMLKELSGIIIAWRDTRAYWSVPMEESDGNMPPDCYSLDARTGEGEPGGNCHKCPNAEFGSGSKGEGQACKLVRQLFLVREDNLLPEIVHLPPSSLKPARQYFLRLASKGVPCYSVITKIGVGEDEERAGHRLREGGAHLRRPPDARADQAGQGLCRHDRPVPEGRARRAGGQGRRRDGRG